LEGKLADAIAKDAPLPPTNAVVTATDLAVANAQRTLDAVCAARPAPRSSPGDGGRGFLADNDVVIAANQLWRLSPRAFRRDRGLEEASAAAVEDRGGDAAASDR
jgi:hypothetical protein